MKSVLIISPYFPPTNAADMQRIRMSLPYFRDLGWNAEIVTVDSAYSDLVIDSLLCEAVPDNTIIHLIKAFPKKWTGKFGLGSIALRSIGFYHQKVNRLLQQNKYDLVYFSTTQFPVCILGAYWKKRFGIPYVIDMQDPWHSEYYRDKPKNERPPKYWFSYRLNKWLEPVAMKQVSGLISVSQNYIDDLKNRYPKIKDIPSSIITFGGFQKDFEVANKNAGNLTSHINPGAGRTNMVYVGRGGKDMQFSINILFLAMLKGLASKPDHFKQFHFYFIGTSYASKGNGMKSIKPLADKLGLNDHVTEVTDRIGYHDAILTLQNADVLFVPGSDDPKYTASKLFPYIMCKKPLLALFHEKSNAVKIISECSPGAHVLTFPAGKEQIIDQVYDRLSKWSADNIKPLKIDEDAFREYRAEAMAGKQIELFERVLNNKVYNS